MKTKPLRPIGTIFKHRFPPNESSNDPYAHEITYEVVGHIDVYDEAMNPAIAEECVARKVEYFEIDENDDHSPSGVA